MKTLFLSASTVLFLVGVFGLQPLAHAQADFTVGQKVDAGGGYKHKATVLKVQPPSYFLHYDDGSLPDGWEQGYSMRPRTGDTPTAAPSAPRNGKYSIYVYKLGTPAMYDGYFMLNGNSYEVFLPGGKSGGSGKCSFSADAMHWISGPLANPDWNGTQKLEVDGNNQKIRLRTNTVAWNTGS
jgi:hypothetical protein